MHDHSPRPQQPIESKEGTPRPTRENPERIVLGEHDVRHLISIPRTNGGTTGMYEHSRYFDDDGTERVVMHGSALEELPDGKIDYPAKIFSRERLEQIKEQNRQRNRDAIARRSALQAGVITPPSESAALSDVPSLVEFDEHGLIKMPDWNRGEQAQEEVAQEVVPEEAAPEPQPQVEKKESPADKLRRQYYDAIDEKRRAQRAANAEGSMHWGQIAGGYANQLRAMGENV